MAKEDFYTYKHVYINEDGLRSEHQRHYRNKENAEKEFKESKEFYINNKQISISKMDVTLSGQCVRFIFDNNCLAIISWFSNNFDD